MKADEWKVLTRAVEEGVVYGWRRAHKHDPDPDEDTIQNTIIEAVTQELSEWFVFEPVPGLDGADPT